jgi:hypothetical protein
MGKRGAKRSVDYERCYEVWQSSASIQEAATTLGITKRLLISVRSNMARSGYKFKKMKRGPKQTSNLRAIVYRLDEAGMGASDIAREVKCTRQNVHYLLKTRRS